MHIKRALAIIASVHTEDDRDLGFCIRVGASPDYLTCCSPSEYLEAWKEVRQFVDMPVYAAQYPQ